MQRDPLEALVLPLFHRVEPCRNLTEFNLCFVASLFHGQVGVRCQGHAPHFAIDALFDDKRLFTARGDPQRKTAQFRVADKGLPGGRWGRLIDHPLGQLAMTF